MKSRLRKEQRRKLEALRPGICTRNSNLILYRLMQEPEYADARHVCIYLSSNNEVGTHEIILDLFKRKRKVSVPVYVLRGEPKLSRLYQFKDMLYQREDVISARRGVFEPKSFKTLPVNKKSIDLFIVPGVAFSENGHRIGYGRGYYDMLLRGVYAPKIGLAYEIQICDKFKSKKHDIPVDKLITEERVILCR